jgi:hypothetical protein
MESLLISFVLAYLSVLSMIAAAIHLCLWLYVDEWTQIESDTMKTVWAIIVGILFPPATLVWLIGRRILRKCRKKVSRVS